jgi:High potential iron-sulfur protein
MNKESKTDADYTPKATKGDHCIDCVYFLGVSVLNNCHKVLGHVKPKGWCRYWDEK